MKPSTPSFDVSCPCGATLEYHGTDAEDCLARLKEWTAAHKGHVAPVIYRDRWYPSTPYPTVPYQPIWVGGTSRPVITCSDGTALIDGNTAGISYTN